MTKDGKKGRVLSLPTRGFPAFRQGQKMWFKLHARKKPFVTGLLYGSHRERRREYLSWVKRFVEGKGLDIFWKLFNRHDIPPGPMLDYLTRIKAAEIALDWNDEAKNQVKQRSHTRKGRNWIVSRINETADIVAALAEEIPPPLPARHYWQCRSYLYSLSIVLSGKNQIEAQAIQRALGVLEKHKSVPIGEEPAFQVISWLQLLADRVRELPTPKRHRPEAVEVKVIAQDVASYFKDISGKPLPGYVGEILRLAFPEKWNPAGNIKEAAKKLIKLDQHH